MAAPGNLLGGLGDVLGCSVFPADCSVCGTPLAQLNSAPICEACWSEIPAARENCCVCCGEDLFQPAAACVGTGAYCRACRMVPPGFKRAVSFGVYDGSLRAALHALKFQGMAPVVNRLGRLLADAIRQMAQDAPAAMLVVAVPLHGRRRRKRGFNQAEKLAERAVSELRRTNPRWKLDLAFRVLARQRSTESQAGLSPRQRRQNLRGAFFVPEPERVAGRHILLVDDIYTTGATARVCSKVLLAAGAASVWVATVARAQRRFPHFEEKRPRYMQVVQAEEEIRQKEETGVVVH